MVEVVINRCYGGFGLSEAATLRYAEIKGSKLYPERDEKSSLRLVTFWRVPKDERVRDKYGEQTLCERDIPRDDPALVQVVRELGVAADGFLAKLDIVDVPDDAQWQIEEYDGNEWVAECHRTW